MTKRVRKRKIIIKNINKIYSKQRGISFDILNEMSFLLKILQKTGIFIRENTVVSKNK